MRNALFVRRHFKTMFKFYITSRIKDVIDSVYETHPVFPQASFLIVSMGSIGFEITEDLTIFVLAKCMKIYKLLYLHVNDAWRHLFLLLTQKPFSFKVFDKRGP